LCASYVEITRNIPLLLQLFMWYFAMTELLPPIEEPLKPLAGVFFSKNGLQYPLPVWEPGHWGTLIGLCVGIGAWKFWSRHVQQHFEATDSGVAKALLADWITALGRFTKVMPKDYKRVLAVMQKATEQGLDPIAAVMGA